MSKLVKSEHVSYVYLIGYDDKIKIGKANNPKIRLSQLQVGIPDKIYLKGAIGCCSEEAAYELEESLHKRFENDNIRAEWFNLTKEDCSKILCEYVDHLDVEIPRGMLRSMMKDLKSGETNVALYYLSRPAGWVFVDSEIAEYVGTSERSMKANRKSARTKGYLE